MKVILIIFINFIALGNVFAHKGYEYNFIEKLSQKIHVLKIDPNDFEISLSSAHNSVFGREKIGDIANRENAFIAINAGFFQIGANEDGRPTGTLIIDGQLFGLRTSKHSVFVIRDQKLSIETWHPKIQILVGSGAFVPKKFNKPAGNTDIVLYSSKWLASTLTDYEERNEIVISKDMKVMKVSYHGNNAIEKDGYVISLAKTVDISFVKKDDKVMFNNDKYSIFNQSTSALMGIPNLITNGQVHDDLADSKNHARTAIGIDKNGKIIIAVVECSDIHSSTGVKNLILDKLTNDNLARGMTILELAEFMQNLGCVSAINLDGGGSSSLYIDGKYLVPVSKLNLTNEFKGDLKMGGDINQSSGDEEEAQGCNVIRPVSDAILFKKKLK